MLYLSGGIYVYMVLVTAPLCRECLHERLYDLLWAHVWALYRRRITYYKWITPVKFHFRLIVQFKYYDNDYDNDAN